MHQRPIHASRPGWNGSSSQIIDRYVLVSVAAFGYVVIALPLLIYATTTTSDPGKSITAVLQNLMMPNPTNKIFWPVLAVVALSMVILNWSRLSFPPHITYLMAYLGFAGTSALWAIKPEISFQRFALQMAILTSIVFPVMLSARSSDVLRTLFICFGFACILNIFIVAHQNPIIIENVILGYP